MLLKVGIDPDAGEELADSRRPPGPLFMRYLRERCLLVADRGSAADLLRSCKLGGSVELVEAIALLMNNRLSTLPDPAPVPLCDVDRMEQIETWQTSADLLVLAEYRLQALLEQSGPAPHPEIASLREALNTAAVYALNEHWETHLTKGTNRETVWRDRFALLARHTNEVHIIDRYAASSLARAVTAPQVPKHKTGAQWFLAHLARSRVRTVHLSSSAREIPQHLTPADMHEAIRSWFAGLSTGTRLCLHVVDGDFDHGRRMAFENWAGFELHNGMASFDKSQLAEDMSLNASTGLGNEVVRASKALGVRAAAVRERQSEEIR